MSTETPLLEVSELTVAYSQAVVVRGANLAISPGEVLGIAGPNGAGKSSLLSAISGLTPTKNGSVHFDGVEISMWPAERRARKGLAFVPEGRGLFGPLSVIDNLLVGAYGSHPKKRELEERLERTLRLFPKLRERLQQRANTLSGGEAAMLSICRALMSDPRVLILDEPSLGLAPIASKHLFHGLSQLQSGTEGPPAIILIEQKAHGLLEIATRLAVMAQGRLRELDLRSFTTEDIVTAYFGKELDG